MRKIGLAITFLFIVSCFSTFAQEKAIPKKGEGITSFLQRNNRPGKESYQKFVELNRAKLGTKIILQANVEYLLPPLSSNKQTLKTTGSKRTEPLFGKKWADYTIESDKLKDACFYLVSGHGGPDCGAIGKVGNKELHEDEYAYDIMLRLARNLRMQGATVHIIIQDAKDGIRDEEYLDNSKRETCMGAPIPLNQKARLKQRCDKINSLNRKDKETYRRAIFMHLDSRSKKQQTDVFFYYANKSAESKRLANTLKDNFEYHYDKHQPNRGFTGTVSTRSLYVMSNTIPVSVFVELGNIQNSFDQKRFVMSSNRQALANWMCRGLIKDYEKSKKK